MAKLTAAQKRMKAFRDMQLKDAPIDATKASRRTLRQPSISKAKPIKAVKRIRTVRTASTRTAIRRTNLAQMEVDRFKEQYGTRYKQAIDVAHGRLPSSSFITNLHYNDETGIVDAHFNGRPYSWKMPKGEFKAWTKGAASCRTSDTGKRKRWVIFDTPSLGAYYNQYIRGNAAYRI